MEVKKMFERKELQEIERRALKMANVKGTNSSWKRVYLRLADACCELDAYLARIRIHQVDARGYVGENGICGYWEAIKVKAGQIPLPKGIEGSSHDILIVCSV